MRRIDRTGTGEEGPARAGGPPRYFALAEVDGVLLAGTCGRGLARSADGGASWTVIESPFAGADVNEVCVDPAGAGNEGRPSLLVAGGQHGLFRSHDAGISWERIGPRGAAVYCARRVGGELLVGTADGLWSERAGGRWGAEPSGPTGAVYRIVALRGGGAAVASESSGVWLRSGAGEWASIGSSEFPVYALVELDDGDLLAGTRGAGIVRWSRRTGEWHQVSCGPVDPVVHTIVRAGGELLAGTGQGVVRALADGERWTAVGVSLAHHRIFSLLARGDRGVVAGSYDGLWALAPSGDAWAALETGLDVGGVFAIADITDRAGGDSAVLAGGRAGVFRSDDGGTTWAPIRPDAVTGNAYCFCVTDDGIYVGTDDGLWNAGAGRPGIAWERAGLDGRRVFTLLEVEPGLLLAGLLGDGVWVRPGAGGEWRRCDSLDHPLAFDLLRSVSTGAVLVATGRLDGGAKSGGIFRSFDAGQHWEPAEAEAITVYDLCETSGGIVVAGAQRCRILRSTDGGATFTTTRPHGRDESKMYCLAIDGCDRLFLGAGAELLRSDDAGESWWLVGDGLDGVTVFGVAHVDGDRLLAATSSGVYRSDDAGITWTPSHWS